MRIGVDPIGLPGGKKAPEPCRGFLAVGLAVLILVSGCRQEPTIDPKFESIIDRSFITGQPCAPPCWYGLQPGKSTEEEVLGTLAQRPFFVPGSIVYRKDDTGLWLEWNCVYDSSKSCGSAGVSEGKLEYIWLDFAYGLYMEEVVSRLGPPDQIGIILVPPAGGARAVLVWREKKVAVAHLDVHNGSLYSHLDTGNKFPRGVKATYAIYGSFAGLECRRLGKCIPWPGFE